MTRDELRKAEAHYRRAFRRAEDAREARNAAVRTALAEGWTHAKISEATGLSRGRIGQVGRNPHEITNATARRAPAPSQA